MQVGDQSAPWFIHFTLGEQASDCTDWTVKHITNTVIREQNIVTHYGMKIKQPEVVAENLNIYAFISTVYNSLAH